MRKVDTARLRYYMDKAGCRSVTDLEKASGVNRNTLSGMLSGKVLPSSDVMDRIITAINIPIAEAGGIFFAENLHDTQEKEA